MSRTLSAENPACRWQLADKKGRPCELPEPLAPLADTHGHLTHFRRNDPAMTIARAALAGVRLLVVPVDPTDDVLDVPTFLTWWEEQRAAARELLVQAAAEGFAPPEFPGWGELLALVDNLHWVAGAHPYGAERLLEDAAARERLEALLGDPRCIGVGEIGLDFGPYAELPTDVQEEAFRLQLRMAHKRRLPVELHLRDGADDTLAHDLAARVLHEEGVPEAGCDLHCYTSGPEVMAPFVELGCHVAFGGAATFSRSDDIRAAAAACPGELVLSETDCPYMAPVPLRGQECEPAMVALTARFLADLRAEQGVPVAETFHQLWANACGFFGLSL